jgi:hypothetical protein
MILLDSQSTHSTFYVRRLVDNICEAAMPLRTSTNGGEIIYRQIADLSNYGTVWFNENSIENIISMSEAEQKGHKISYSPGCLTLTNAKNGHNSEFQITPSGLYAYTVPLNGTAMVQTIRENEQLFTPRQVIQAQKARELYKMIGRPLYNNFTAIVKNNLLLNTKITPRDILHAEAIYGIDLGSLQGKTTRKQPSHVIIDYVQIAEDILKHHNVITLAGDIMTIGGILFLITTSRNIQFTTIEKLESKTTKLLVHGLIKVIQLYQRQGLMVQTLLADNEFETVRDAMNEREVNVNICAPHEHVPEVERKIRTVKERVRGILTTLPFKVIPSVIIVHAVVFSVMWINFFPPKDGVSQFLLPQTIVTGLTADAEKHCKTTFGGYAHVTCQANS